MNSNTPMNDNITTITQLKMLITTFVAEREWQQFHDPKNLVMALSSEVGELADIFRWVPSEKSLATMKSWVWQVTVVTVFGFSCLGYMV